MAIRADEGKHTPRPARLSARRPARTVTPMRGGTASTTPGAPVIGQDGNGSAPGDDDPDARVAAGPRRGRLWMGRLLVLASVAAAAVTLVATDNGVQRAALDIAWQLVDPAVLADDPLGSVWYLHVQPPLYNLVVGVIAWLGLPPEGALYVVFVASLLGTGLLLHGLLVRWGIGPVVSGLIVGLALLNPSLLSTMTIASYEVPVALLLVASLWAMQRHLDEPGTGWLLATSALVTLTALTRSLFNPPWVAVVLVLVLVARPVSRRQALAALAIPLVLVGGWMLKNQILFGTPTTSSWLGFNMQRGIVAPLDAEMVRDDVRSGEVSDLALSYPWGLLDEYDEWLDGCEPAHDHPAVSDPRKPDYRNFPVANFNHECYLPLYSQAQEDAVTLARRHPGRYLHDRAAALAMSYRVAEIGAEEDTWLDSAYETLLWPVTVEIDMDDWNLPLFVGADENRLPFTASTTLMGLSVFVGVRGLVALWRLARVGWRQRAGWPAFELEWLVVSFTTAVIILGGDLIEFGENGRFRSTLDPLLVTMPLASLALVVRHARERRAAAGAPDEALDGAPAPA